MLELGWWMLESVKEADDAINEKPLGVRITKKKSILVQQTATWNLQE